MKPRKKKRGRNKGWFKKGFDSRRSNYRPTKEECIRGFLAALDACLHDADKTAWFYRHIRSYYRRKEHVQKETARRLFGAHGDDAPG
jgi:hypothetical protein